MRDGIALRADVIRPAGDRPVPVILMRSPYGPIVARANLDPLRAVAEGFAVVTQSVRGTGASGGDFMPWAHEAADGYDSVAWCAGAAVVNRPRCDLRPVLPGPGAAVRGRRTTSGPRGDGSLCDAVTPVRGHLRGRGPAPRIDVRLGVRAGRRRHRAVSLDRPDPRARCRLACLAGHGRGHRQPSSRRCPCATSRSSAAGSRRGTTGSTTRSATPGGTASTSATGRRSRASGSVAGGTCSCAGRSPSGTGSRSIPRAAS